MTDSKRIALYARVSTKNNGQDPETQLIALREYAKTRMDRLFDELKAYSEGDIESGSAGKISLSTRRKARDNE